MIDLPPTALETVRAILRAHLGGHEVRAFGSRVTGRARRHSDLDLAVMGSEGVSWQTLARLREAFEESDLPIVVDVIDWARCSDEFRRAVAPQMEPL